MRTFGRGLALLAALGCDVPEPDGRTTGYPGGDAEVDSADGSACGRGFVVVGAPDDYASVNVSLVGPSGEVLSESFASSATNDVGLAPPLTGDVVAPTSIQRGGELVLVDRLASQVVWFDLESAEELGRLDVGGGFVTYPHDYVRVSAEKAYVTRYERNPDRAAPVESRGGDVLVIDPSARAIVGSIDLRSAMASDALEFQPRPDRIVAARGRVFVLLAPSTADFRQSAAARLIEIDPESDSVVDVLMLDGFAGCTGLAVAPDEETAVVGCIAFDGDFGVDPARSGVVEVTLDPVPRISAALWSEDLGGHPAGFYVEYAAPRVVLATVIGERGAATKPDILLSIDLERRAVEEILTPAEPFVIGEVRCACSYCVVADASVPGGQLQPVEVRGGAALLLPPVVVKHRSALPPRYVGRF